MKRGCLPLLVLLLQTAALPAQSADPNSAEEKGSFLGVLISPVPEVLYDHLDGLSRGQGVVVTHVLPESPAAAAGLRRHDILLDYNDSPIRDGEQFARFIRAGKPEQKIKLGMLRNGRRMVVEATLTLGPVLKIAGPSRPTNIDGPGDAPRGIAKPASPLVRFAAAPLDGGRLKVTLEYADKAGPTQTVVCEGTPAQLEDEFQKLPPRVQNLANVALRRIRDLEFQQGQTGNRLPRSRGPR